MRNNVVNSKKGLYLFSLALFILVSNFWVIHLQSVDVAKRRPGMLRDMSNSLQLTNLVRYKLLSVILLCILPQRHYLCSGITC
jgi:hypothetical protein